MSYLLLLRSHWKLVGFGLLVLLLAVQTVRLAHRSNQLEREKINSNELRAELKAISDKRNEQKAETKQRIDQADKGNKAADTVAKKIEAAPLPGNCATPVEIMGADA